MKLGISKFSLRPFLFVALAAWAVVYVPSLKAQMQTEPFCFDASSLSPISVDNGALSVGSSLARQECEAKRHTGDFQSPTGFCGCLADLARRSRDANLLVVDYDRAKEVEQALVREGMRQYAEDYVDESLEFAGLYLSAEASGLYKDNEIYAHMTHNHQAQRPMTPEEFERAPNKEKLIELAKQKLEGCSGQGLVSSFEEMRKQNFCEEGMQSFTSAAINSLTEDADGDAAYANVATSLRKAGDGADAQLAFIQVGAMSGVVNEGALQSAGIVDNNLNPTMDRFRRGEAVSLTELPSVISLASEVQGNNRGVGTVEVAEVLKAMADLVAADESSSEYPSLLERAGHLLEEQPSYLKALQSQYKVDNVQDALKSFMSANSNLKALPAERLGRALTLKLNDVQRAYFDNGLKSCNKRVRKFYHFCRALSKDSKPVHPSLLIDLGPDKTDEIINSIARNEGITDDVKRSSLRSDLDVLTCVAEADPRALCGTTAAQKASERDIAARLDYSVFFPIEPEARRRERTGRYCPTLPSLTGFYPGYRSGGEYDTGKESLNDAKAAKVNVLGVDLTEQALADETSGPSPFLQTGRGADALNENAKLNQSLSRVFEDVGDVRSRSLARARDGGNPYRTPSVLAGSGSGVSVKSASQTTSASDSISSGVNNFFSGKNASRSADVSPVISHTSAESSRSPASVEGRVEVEEKSEVEKKAKNTDASGLSNEAQLRAQIASLKAELDLLKQKDEGADDNKSLAQIEADLAQERALKTKLEDKARELAAEKASGRQRQNSAAATFVNNRDVNEYRNPKANTASEYRSDSFIGPAADSQMQSGRLNAPQTQGQAAGAGAGRDSASAQGLELIVKDYYQVKGDGALSDPTMLAPESYEKIKSELASGTREVFVKFPNGDVFAYSENPETNEIEQRKIAADELPLESIADIKQRDEERMNYRAPASLLENPEIDPTSSSWAGLVDRLKKDLDEGIFKQRVSP